MKKVCLFLLSLLFLLPACVEPQTGGEEPVKPEEVKLQIVVADDAFQSLRGGETLQVTYEVKTPQNVSYTLNAYHPEGWSVSISVPRSNKGTLTVTLPSGASAGKIMLAANGSDGSCFVKVLGVGGGSATGTVEAYEAVDASGGSLELPSGATSIRISASEEWVSLKGGQLVLAENTTYDSRQALVTFTVDKRTCELTLVQAQIDAIVLVSNEWQVAAEGETLDFVVRANVPLEADCSADWLTLEEATKGLEDKPFRITATANDTEEIRKAVITFSSGSLSQSVTVSQAPLPSIHTGDFQLLTDASVLEPGDLLLVVNQKGTMAMASQMGTYRSIAGVEPEYDIIQNPGRNVAVITLAGSPGEWQFCVTGGYLAASAEDKNQLLTVETLSECAQWTIEVDPSGVATVKSLGGTRNLLCYNTHDMRFCCYLTDSDKVNKVTLYYKPSNEKTVQDNEVPGVYLGGRNTRIYQPGEDQQVRSYQGGEFHYVILDPATREQISVSGYREGLSMGEAVSVHVLWKKGWNILLSNDYEFTLLKEENGKVWLGDLSGRGVIIKK